MKKFMYLAVLAGVALVGCTKNERTTELIDSQKEITFTAPVVTPVTKADYYTTNNLGTNSVSFDVFGWYCEGTGLFDPTTAVPYMGTGSGDEITSPVTVSYHSGNKDDINSGTAGYWAPTTPYYWPKNGKLTFSAYAPSSAKSDATSLVDNKKTGLKFTAYTVKDLANQYDLLYSKRTFDRTSSTEGDNSDYYDGVELTFCHALSAIEPIIVSASSASVIRIKEISLQNVYNKGDFNQNMTNGKDDANTARTWTAYSGAETSYTLFSTSEESEYYVATTTATAVTNCKNAILLPQDLNHSGDTGNKVKIVVKYQIKHGDAYLDQEFAQELAGLTDTGLNTVNAWEIGKRYIYTLHFGLNDIYFAPIVEDWKDVNVTVPTI